MLKWFFLIYSCHWCEFTIPAPFSIFLMTAVNLLYQQAGLKHDMLDFAHLSVHLANSSFFSKCFGSSHTAWQDSVSIAGSVMNRCQIHVSEYGKFFFHHSVGGACVDENVIKPGVTFRYAECTMLQPSLRRA